MRTLDFKYCDIHADTLDFYGVRADTFDELRVCGYCVVADRGAYRVCVRNGVFHLARYAPLDRFDGVHLIEVAETSIRYDDDCEIVSPSS